MDRKTRKEIRQLVKTEQLKGKADKDIHADLVEKYGYRKTIAKIIVTTVKPEYKNKHRLYAGILLAFAFFIVLFNIWGICYGFLNGSEASYESESRYLITQFIQSILFLAMFFSIVLLKKDLTFYGISIYAYLFLIPFLLFLSEAIIKCLGISYLGLEILYVDLIAMIFLSLLAWFFQRKIFPNYRYGNPKQDENGEYIFDSKKTHINKNTKKEIRQLVKELKNKNKSNQEIYDELVSKYFDTEFIAKCIVTTLHPKDKKKHYFYNGILFLLTLATIFLNALVIKIENLHIIKIHFYCYFLVLCAIIIFALKHRGNPYSFWTIFAFFSFFYALLVVLLNNGFSWQYITVNLLSMLFIIYPAQLFQRKIFPNFRWKKLKQNERGEYIFD